MNRRRFFLGSLAGAGSALLLGRTLSAESAAAPAPAKAPAAAPLTRTLGRTGIRVPVVSMGVMNADNPELLRQAYLQGIRYFDTAWYYQRGNNEKMVGRVLREVCPERSQVVVSTKVFLGDLPPESVAGPQAKEVFLRRFAESLSRLKMEYVDILFYHALESRDEALNPHILEAFAELRKQGKIRFAGVSTHSYWPDFLPAIADAGVYDVAMLSFNYSMHSDPRYLEAARHAVAKGMGLVAMKTQCQQDWYRKMLPAEMQKFYEGQIMHPALLKWALRHEEFATAVPGFTTYQQLEEDVAVSSGLAFTPEERRFLEDHQVKLALEGSCQVCGRCRGTCPKGADIPNLMRTHMYAFSYGNVAKAGETLASLGEAEGLSACAACTACVARCSRRVDVPGRIGELRAVYC